MSETKWRLDFGTLGGLIVAVGGIFGGLILEGGSVRDVAQITGALIVFGGTLGAVMVTTPAAVLFRAFKGLRFVFLQPSYPKRQLIDQIMSFANRARRNGIVSLEPDIERIADPFLKKALSLGVDGTDLQDLQQMMELEMEAEERRGRAAAKAYDAAGGYAPTVGIIGAVLGLIQVMKHLDQIDMVGHGIAVAFVATVYGVGSANLFFLPAGAKIRARFEESSQLKQMMLDGVSGIVQGLHPKVIERKLEAYLNQSSNEERRNGSRESDRASAEAA